VILSTVLFFRRRRLTAPGPQANRAWQALATLSDARRREVYEFVAQQDRPVTRDEAGQALGMSRSLVAFHLDKLADAGLLDVSFARSPDRPAGRGAGRPSKRYRVSDLDLGVSIPPRRYDLVGRILARTLGAAGQSIPAETGWEIAAEEGRRLGQGYLDGLGGQRTVPVERVQEVLTDCGYSPMPDGRQILLRNCPFLAVAADLPEQVCALNHGFVNGVLQGVGAVGMAAERMEHRLDGCCVRIDTGVDPPRT
jgi:predicted ArsR family transcriptional regulator